MAGECIYYSPKGCKLKSCTKNIDGKCRDNGLLQAYHGGPTTMMEQVGIYKDGAHWVIDDGKPAPTRKS